MYIEYKPLSQKPDSSTYVPFELSEAQKSGILKIDPKIRKNWDDWVANELKITKEALWESYSSEQIDSIGICIYNFLKNDRFIIGDETGIGKGRILSGISRWGWINNKKILFFTEREHLLTEFWKDLNETNNTDLIKNPVIFHSTSKIYNPDMSIALRGTTKSVREIEANGFAEDTNIVFTNYSQISLKQHKKNKLSILEEYCNNSIIIMDESHNATGDSNTKEFLLNLIEKTPNIVFSSATFIKDESQFEIYEKSFKFTDSVVSLMKKIIKNDDKGTLRKILTYELTKNLQFWRREHEPLKIGWQTIFCDNEEEINKYVENYSVVINKLFNIVSNISKQSESIENQQVTNAWFSLGATINRLSRNLLLILKTPMLVKSVEKSLENDHKAVIVIDSTLSSMIKKIHQKYLDENLINNEGNDDSNEFTDTEDSEYIYNFQQSLVFVIDEILKEYISHNQHDNILVEEYKDLLKSTEFFSSLTISPIDYIKENLQTKNIACGEISGRKIHLQDNKIKNLKLEPKTKIVKDFNDGKINVLIITRAGASGISAHSNRAFIDQRVRDLYELEITNRPTYRLQFMGRVNRKNQVHQPLFFSIVTKLPFEQRIVNIERNKLNVLQSHISGETNKLNEENIINLYNPYTDSCAFDYLKNNPSLAYQMGISLKTKKSDYYYIDSLLKRCIVLSPEKQNFLYDFLISTVVTYQKIQVRKNNPSKITVDNIKTFWHQLDIPQQEEFKKIYGNFPHLSINQFKFPWVGIASTKYHFLIDSVFDKTLEKEYLKNKSNESEALNVIAKSYKFIIRKNLYNNQYLDKHIKPMIDKLSLGKQMILKTDFGKIFGYIHNIEYPQIKEAENYPNLILFHIKTINPSMNENVFYAPEDYFITLKEIIESHSIEVKETPINWTHYSRAKREIIRDNYCLVGHPVYLQFLQSSYGIGEIEYLNFNGENKMCYVVPKIMKKEDFIKIRKPIYQPNKIMELLIARKISNMTTTWRSEEEEKPSLKLESTTGGYNLMIANEIHRDKEFIDFPMKKKLSNYRGATKDGYHCYFIIYKEIRTILFMLEKREVIWFI